MEGLDPRAREYAQRLNVIFAWSRLLQLGEIGDDARTRALQSIQQNTEHLLLQVTGKSEISR